MLPPGGGGDVGRVDRLTLWGAKWFGELEEESGPSLGGRPAVGTKVETRLPDDVLAAVDERASTEGTTRAEMIRRLVTAGL